MSDTTPESKARAATASLIRDYYAAFNKGDSDAMLAFLTDDVIHDVNQGERRQGKDKFKAFNARMDHNYKEELKDIVVLVSKDATRAAAEFNVHGVSRIPRKACRRLPGKSMCCRPAHSLPSATARFRA